MLRASFKVPVRAFLHQYRSPYWQAPGAEERNKVDGAQTSCPGRESSRELSGTGWRSDLYSRFGVERNLGDLPFDILEERSSVQVIEDDLRKLRPNTTILALPAVTSLTITT
jgi:hypothetical protein